MSLKTKQFPTYSDGKIKIKKFSILVLLFMNITFIFHFTIYVHKSSLYKLVTTKADICLKPLTTIISDPSQKVRGLF